MTIQTNITGVLSDGYSIISPYQQGIDFYQGDDGYVNIAMVDSLNQPLNITGGELILTARNAFSGALVLSINAELIDAITGLAQFYISSANTTKTDFPYPYDVVYINNDNTSHVIGEGSFFNVLLSIYEG